MEVSVIYATGIILWVSMSVLFIRQLQVNKNHAYQTNGLLLAFIFAFVAALIMGTITLTFLVLGIQPDGYMSGIVLCFLRIAFVFHVVTTPSLFVRLYKEWRSL